MHFEIRAAGRIWTWVLLDAAQMTVLESDRTFPSETQASAAALAFAKLVTREDVRNRRTHGRPDLSLARRPAAAPFIPS